MRHISLNSQHRLVNTHLASALSSNKLLSLYYLLSDYTSQLFFYVLPHLAEGLDYNAMCAVSCSQTGDMGYTAPGTLRATLP